MIVALWVANAAAWTPNVDLREQLAEQPWRTVPRTRRVAAAADVRVEHNLSLEPEVRATNVFHAGSTNELYGEAEPFDDWVLNLRLSVTVTSYSYGAGGMGFVHPWPAVTFGPALTEGLRLRARIGDLDRVTVGAGLILTDKELGGVRVELLAPHIARGGARATVLRAGTGGVDVGGDFAWYAVEPIQEHLGLYIAEIDAHVPRFYGGWTTVGPQWLRGSLEGAWRAGAAAGLARVHTESAHDARARLSFDLHARGFAPGALQRLSFQADYLSPTQDDKDAFDTFFLLVDHDRGVLGAADLTVAWDLTDVVGLQGRHEAGRVWRRDVPTLPVQHYFHAAALVRPRCDPSAVFRLEITNKTSNALWSPAIPDRRRIRVFSDVLQVRTGLRMAL